MVLIQDIELIKQFVDKYNSAQASLDGHNKEEAKKQYKDLLKLYSTINHSKLDKENKELAYEQIMKVYRGVHSTDAATSMLSKRFFFTSKPTMIVAGILIILSLVVFIKPEIIGFVLEPSIINSAPEWKSPQNFFDAAQPQTIINLDSYFSDPEGSRLTYLATAPQGVQVEINNQHMIITPQPGAYGTREITIIASDGTNTAKKQIGINIINKQQPFNLGR